MDNSFKIITLTPPEITPDEGQIITKMLESKIVDYVHLRHPEASKREMAAILDSVPKHLHPRIRIHSHFTLLKDYDLAGSHLNNKWPICTVSNVKSITKSCHTLKELADGDTFDYVTLSPVYSSSSRKGYVGDYEAKSLTKAIKNKNVVALGGVSPDKFLEIKKSGFVGAGMLGYIWKHDVAKALRHIKMFRDNNFSLQYVTNLDTPEGVAKEVKAVLDGGCKWIQVRMKEATDDVIIKTVETIRPMCNEAGALIVIDDRVDLVKKLDVDGVHLGKNDMTPAEAREILGDLKIIGSTANTFIDIMKLDRAGIADYICLGPMRFTETKKNLAPTLGFEGILDVFDDLVDSQIDLPIVIMGGVRLPDVQMLLDLGATGLAINAAIRKSDDATATTRQFLHALHN